MYTVNENMQNFNWKIFKKTTLVRCRRRWESNIKMDVKQIVCEHVDWIQLV
jgi:hypothetical protein